MNAHAILPRVETDGIRGGRGERGALVSGADDGVAAFDTDVRAVDGFCCGGVAGDALHACGPDGSWVATVPDLITVADRETGEPIRTEALRYGARVIVIGIPTPEIMRTDAALDVWGPETFGLETDFVPLAGT